MGSLVGNILQKVAYILQKIPRLIFRAAKVSHFFIRCGQHGAGLFLLTERNDANDKSRTGNDNYLGHGKKDGYDVYFDSITDN